MKLGDGGQRKPTKTFNVVVAATRWWPGHSLPAEGNAWFVADAVYVGVLVVVVNGGCCWWLSTVAAVVSRRGKAERWVDMSRWHALEVVFESLAINLKGSLLTVELDGPVGKNIFTTNGPLHLDRSLPENIRHNDSRPGKRQRHG
ncbi:hypothetical protein Salat_1893500 [Sesamum alatum]|uniref:Uncharacterized protein n=1 Tax=Sesamum alatum TaxID=300844 RepID=A0AAE2CID7_9LAMI|nr:hypothetical protein Salat_1893500 [Sesamum alatum]